MAFTGGGGTAAVAAGAAQILRSAPERVEDAKRLSLSPRQQDLDRRWAYYRCDQYAARKVAWDGSRVLGQTEHDAISIAGYIPPNFYIAGLETLPIQFRKPTTPYHLCKVIVDRFTSLLFGQKRHPRVAVEGDDDTEQFLQAVIEVGRMWPAFMQARTYGGATGTAVVGFKLLQGRPQFEVFDPRWCQPKFLDRANLILQEIEYRHTFKQDVRHPDTGEWMSVDFWYRRVIDLKSDVIFEPVRVDPNNPPTWIPATEVQHNLGFCPVVWVQNHPGDTEIDGDPDCMGVYELADAIDRLNAQSERGILANCDPTVVISTDAQMGEVRKGSNNALKLPQGGSATYMEMNGSGVLQAREQAAIYKESALEIAQCVLEQPDGQKTATEVERNFAAMLACADTLREQYGELGVKRLLNMVLVAASQLGRPRIVDGVVTRFEIKLPRRKDGKEQKLGKGSFQTSLHWPPYFEPNIQDANTAVSAAVNAKVGGLIDAEHAAKYVSTYFQVEDPEQIVKNVQGAVEGDQASIEQMALDAAPSPQAPDKEADAALNGAQVTALMEIVKAVASKELPGLAAIEIIIIGFPVKRDVATKMIRAADPSMADIPAATDVGTTPPATEVAAQETT